MGLNLPEDISPDERYEHWSRIVKRIYSEQRNQGWNHYMFRLFRAVFSENETLSNEGGFIADWATWNYVDSALMLVRRELDTQNRTESLMNLLKDIAEHPEVLTRKRYHEVWGIKGTALPIANHQFDSFEPIRVADCPDQDHIDPEVVRRDLEKVIADTESVRVYAERTRAHRTPKKNMETSTKTFAELHKAISDVRRVIAKYHVLITLSSISQWEPFPQFNTMKPFSYPWIVDLNAVREAAKK